jgi:isopenicillin-N epimerase
VEQIWYGVTERTRILVISHITSPAALILPVRELIRRA